MPQFHFRVAQRAPTPGVRRRELDDLGRVFGYTRELVPFHGDFTAEAQRFIVSAIMRQNFFHDFGRAIQVSEIHRLAHLLDVCFGEQVVRLRRRTRDRLLAERRDALIRLDARLQRLR